MHLGAAIVSACQQRGMLPRWPDKTKEQVYELDLGRGRSVLVYTTAINMVCREVGTDSIKVCAVYKTKAGQERGIGKAKHRVHRVGEIEAIVARTMARIDELAGKIDTFNTCPDCGAPKGVSKAGNEYCLEICWKPAGQRNQPYRAPRRRRYRRW